MARTGGSPRPVGGLAAEVGRAVSGWMDGWLAGWLHGWMDGWMDGWMHVSPKWGGSMRLLELRAEWGGCIQLETFG